MTLSTQGEGLVGYRRWENSRRTSKVSRFLFGRQLVQASARAPLISREKAEAKADKTSQKQQREEDGTAAKERNSQSKSERASGGV